MAAKKKTRKKAPAPKRRPANPLKLSLTVKQEFAVEGGGRAWRVVASGAKGQTELGHLTARNEAEARTKARGLARRALGS